MQQYTCCSVLFCLEKYHLTIGVICHLFVACKINFDNIVACIVKNVALLQILVHVLWVNVLRIIVHIGYVGTACIEQKNNHYASSRFVLLLG